MTSPEGRAPSSRTPTPSDEAREALAEALFQSNLYQRQDLGSHEADAGEVLAALEASGWHLTRAADDGALVALREALERVVRLGSQGRLYAADGLSMKWEAQRVLTDTAPAAQAAAARLRAEEREAIRREIEGVVPGYSSHPGYDIGQAVLALLAARDKEGSAG